MRIYFVRVQIDRFLGIGRFTQPITLDDMSPGLNVVWATNGRGKTCTARAMIALLWANAEHPHQSIAAARLLLDNRDMLREMQKDAGPIDGLPPKALADLYRMSLPDLLESHDEELVERIRKELHGNIDLRGAAGTLEFRLDTPTKGIAEHTDARETYRRLTEVIAGQTEVRAQGRQLDARRQRRDELDDELRLQPYLKHLLDKQVAMGKIEQFRNELEAFPTGMDRVRIGDDDELRARIRDLKTLNERIDQAEHEFQNAQAALQGTNFGDSGPPNRVWRETAEGLVEKVADAEREKSNRIEQLVQSEQVLQRARSKQQKLNTALDEAKKPFLKEPRAHDLTTVGRDLATWRSREQQVRDLKLKKSGTEERLATEVRQADPAFDQNAYTNWIDRDTPVARIPDAIHAAIDGGMAERLTEERAKQVAKLKEDLEQITFETEQAEAAVVHLRAWLARQAEAEAQPNRRVSRLLFGVLGLFTATLVLLALLVHPAWFAALILPAGFAVWLLLEAKAHAPSPAEHAAKEAFNRLQTNIIPESWSPDAVVDCLARHTEGLARRNALQDQYNRQEALKTEAERAEKECNRRNQEARESLRETFGLQPGDLDAGGLVQLLGVLDRLRATVADVHQISEELRCATENQNEHRANVLRFLGDYYQESAIDLEHATRQVEELNATAAQMGQLHTEYAAARDDVKLKEELHSQSEEDFTRADGAFQNALQLLREHLTDWHPTPATLTEVALARPVVRDLVERAEEHEQQSREMARLDRTIVERNNERQDQSLRITSWLENRGFPYRENGDTWDEFLEDLKTRLGFLEAYEAVKAQLHDAESKLRNAEAELQGVTIPDEITDLDQVGLEKKLDETHRIQSELDDLKAEISQIETRLMDTQQGRSLEDAEALHQRALESLSVRRDLARTRSIGHLLTEALREDITPGETGALANAQRLFADFTQDRYALKLSGDAEGDLAARDNSRREDLPLDQLSSGTRVQLLIAARLGFVTSQETTLHPPILLDEALAVSDPQRTTAIMDAVKRLVTNGRQVVYFTAKPEEVHHWESHVEREPRIELKMHPLEEFPRAERPPAPAFEPLEHPRPGAAETIESYGARLGIPPLDPWDQAGADSAHLWYVIDSPALLYRCLRIARTTCGACRFLIQRKGCEGAARDLDCPADTIAQLSKRIEILDHCLEHWRHGRSRRLTEQDLADIGKLDGFGTTAVDGLRDLINRFDGSAEEVLRHAEEIRGFGRKRMDGLKSFLTEFGFVSNDRPHTGEQVAGLLRQDFGDIPDVDAVLKRSGLFESAGGS